MDQYLEDCTKYFAPLDEIEEAIRNNEGICGMSNAQLLKIISSNDELKKDLERYI